MNVVTLLILLFLLALTFWVALTLMKRHGGWKMLWMHNLILICYLGAHCLALRTNCLTFTSSRLAREGLSDRYLKALQELKNQATAPYSAPEPAMF